MTAQRQPVYRFDVWKPLSRWPDLRGERNPGAKLTEPAVRELRARYAAGSRIAALAREYGLSRKTALDAIRGTTWRHVQ